MPLMEKVWFLHYNFTQHGPYTEEEVQGLLEKGTISAKTFAWKRGNRDWLRVSDIPELVRFKPTPTEAAPKKEKTLTSFFGKKKESEFAPEETKESRENRKSPRCPLVARAITTDSKRVTTGLCKDINAGGVLILSDQVPGDIGTKLSVNISPADEKLEAFVAKGKIVRILPNGRGFGLQFEELGSKEKAHIQDFISTESGK